MSKHYLKLKKKKKFTYVSSCCDEICILKNKNLNNLCSVAYFLYSFFVCKTHKSGIKANVTIYFTQYYVDRFPPEETLLPPLIQIRVMKAPDILKLK